MATIIEVAPAPEDDITLSELALRHLGCTGTMSALRKLGTDLYTVRCSCGLAFDAPREGAAREIVMVANTGEPATLSKGSYFAADDLAIEIVPAHWDP